ncbi:MAG TPA: hypothetical protein VK665_02835 [Candidatus Elarobacter sp.]|nr:hypothetical protein [Candidatus Elarobacter sp.]
MRALPLLSVVLTTSVLAACGGGGSSGPGSATAPHTSLAPARTATTQMSLAIPIRTRSAHIRKPSFVSPGLQSIAFYDGTELVYVANVNLPAGQVSSTVRAPQAASPSPTPTQGPQFQTVYSQPGAATVVVPESCTNNTTTETCTLNVTTTPGRHIFDLIAYPNPQTATPPPNNGSDPGPPVTLQGIISSEGEVALSLVAGPNPGATLTLLGVASYAYVTSDSEEVELPYNTPTSFPYQILDSAYAQILTPGDYDNGPVTFTPTRPGVFTVSPTSQTTPPSSPGDQTLTVTCTAINGGTATLLVNAKTLPNTNYASSLVYSPSNYSGGALTSLFISCDPEPPQ